MMRTVLSVVSRHGMMVLVHTILTAEGRTIMSGRFRTLIIAIAAAVMAMTPTAVANADTAVDVKSTGNVSQTAYDDSWDDDDEDDDEDGDTDDADKEEFIPAPGIISMIPVYRLYNPHSGLHVYTTDEQEKTRLSFIGWNAEGIAFKQLSDGVPVYRAYNPHDGNHHWTASAGEYKTLTTKYGWKAEGIAWYQSANGTVNVYRAYNTENGEHLYTTSKTEYDTITAGKSVWRAEGIAWKSL